MVQKIFKTRDVSQDSITMWVDPKSGATCIDPGDGESIIEIPFKDGQDIFKDIRVEQDLFEESIRLQNTWYARWRRWRTKQRKE